MIYIKNVFLTIFHAINKLVIFLINYLSPCAESIRGELNEQEVYRVVSVTLSSGGSIYAILKGLYGNVDTLVTNPVLANQIKIVVESLKNENFPLVIMIVIFILDSLRRKYAHGESQ